MPDGDRPIFVVGAHRSGTTLLTSLIGAHPRIAAPPEIGFYGRIWAHRDRFGDLRDDTALHAVVNATLDRPTLRDAGFDVESVFARARSGPRTYAGVLQAVMSDFAAMQGKPRWCEKTPLQPVAWLWEQFPSAQLVHIVRDPRDSIASHRNLPWENPPPVELARRWRRFTEPALHDGPRRGESSYLRIRYEDLARSPGEVLAAVFAFLGENFDAAVVTDAERRRATVPSVERQWLAKVVGPITPPEHGAWRSQLSRLDQARVSAVVGPFLPTLGYEAAGGATIALGRVVNSAIAPLDAGRCLASRLGRRLGRSGAKRA